MLALLAWLTTAAPAQQEPVEAPVQAPAEIMVQGTVVDQRGAPLEGAWITVEGAPSHTRSGVGGNFSLPLRATMGQPVVLKLSLAGFEDATVRVVAPPAGPLMIAMSTGTPLGGGAMGEIVVEDAQEEAAPIAHVLDREQVELTPGTHSDAVRLVQALPGVAVTREYAPGAGALAIRGSGPDEHRLYLDGVELPYLFHFKQFTSVVNTGLLEELTLYPSAVGAAHGDATGAVVDARTQALTPDRPLAGIDVNAIMAGGMLRTPLGRDLFLSASGRRSYMDWIVGGGSGQYTVWPVFWDAYARLDHVPNPDHRTALTVLAASDRWERLVREPEELDPFEAKSEPVLDYSHRYLTTSLIRHDASGSYRSDGTVALVLDRWPAELQSWWQDRRETNLQAREDLVWLMRDDLHLAVGARARAERVLRVAAVDQAWPEVVQEAPLLARGVPVDERIDRVRAGAYAELRANLGSWRILPGVRLDHDTLTGAWSPDPRLGLKWRPTPSLTVRAGLGRYSQFPSSDALSPATGDPTLPAIRSEQIALGMDGVIHDRLTLTADAYAKGMREMVLETPGEAPMGGVEGRAVGGEFGARYRIRKVFFFWTTVSMSHSQRLLEGSWIPFDWYQPLTLGLVASWTFRPSWNAGLRYRYGAGFPYTPVVDGVYQASSDSYEPTLGERNSATMPVYQKIDLHLEHRWERDHWRGAIYAEGWIIPGRANEMYPVYSYDYDEETFVYGPHFVPILGVRGELY
jgi:hypothetical protein